MEKAKRRKIFVTFVIGSAVFIAVAILAYFRLLGAWQHQLADTLYVGRPPSTDIVIVGIDSETLEKPGFTNYETWQRDKFATVIANINKHNPKAVVLDFFLRTAKESEPDNNLKDAFLSTKSPVILFRMNPSSFNPSGYFVQEQTKRQNDLPYELFSSLPNVILATGNVIKDGDGVVRRMMPLIYDESTQKPYENIAFAVSRIFLDGKKISTVPTASPSNYIMEVSGNKLSIPLEDGQMIINYANKPNQTFYPTLSFFEVYNEDYENYGGNPKDIFENKIVLIGPTAAYFSDIYTTPPDNLIKMPGTEIQANAIQTILEQKFLRNFTLPEDLVLIFILSALSVFVFMFTRIRWSALYLVAVPAAYTLAAQPAFNSGLILDMVHPYIAIVAAFIAVYVYRYLTEFKEKSALKSAFSRYVNPQIAAQIAEHPEQMNLGGEKRDVTVLFTDIVHFTTISEQMKAESVVAFLNEYLEAMTQVIQSEGGTVDKYEGDAIMAFFGAPLAQADHAVRACNAALKMRVRRDELLKKWETDTPLPGGEKKPVIDFRCGLSSGEVLVGNIGSKEKTEYTVIGDIVNLGSRLEGQNKEYDTRIVVSQATWDIVKDKFEGRELDTIKVVGKTQPIKIYELLNIKGQLVPAAAALLKLYNEGIGFYYERKFAEGLAKFEEILKQYTNDGPSKIYRQRCEVFRDFPPKPNWDWVYEKRSK